MRYRLSFDGKDIGGFDSFEAVRLYITEGCPNAARSFDRHAEEDGGVIRWGQWEAVDTFDECADCPGWGVYNECEIQRCDTCKRYETDEDAEEAADAAARALGFRGWRDAAFQESDPKD